MRLLFSRLEEHGIVINPHKCLFGVKELDFLGHHIDCNGITPLADKVKAVRDFPQPQSQRKLRQFIGMVNFYHRFVPHCAQLMQPLHELLTPSKVKSQTVTWNDVAEQAFNNVNGMVERLHRQLKAALKAHGNTSWMDSLPLVLLGIRTAVKEDIQCTAAVYGTTLRLPGELITPSHPESVNTFDFVAELKTRMQQALPKPPRPVKRNSHVSDDLNTCTHVFIRHDAVRKPLQPPYDGPYAVLKRNNKHFTININGRTDTVSLDRLKPVYVDIDVASTPTSHASPVTQSPSGSPALSPAAQPTAPAEKPRVTRSGRHVHWPKHFALYVT